MFETAGPLTIVELVSSFGGLLALLLLPLLSASVSALSAITRRGARFALRVSVAAAGGAFALAVVHAARAAQLARGVVAEEHLTHLARIGQLDLCLDLARTPTSAACSVLVTFVALAAVLHAVWTDSERVAARLGLTSLTTVGVLLLVLADGLPAFVLGLQLATVGGWALSRGGSTRALAFALSADVAVLFAGWLLFWSLGGSFGSSGYVVDGQARFAVVAAPSPPRPDGKAEVSMTTYHGAQLSSDEGPPLPGEPLRAPFTILLDPGVYSFHIEAGAASSDVTITHVTLAPGHAYVLSPYGPTTSTRNLSDQIAVPRPTLLGPTSMLSVLRSRSLFGIHVTSLVALLGVLAALCRLAFLARTQRGGLVYVLDAVPPVMIAFHAAPLAESAHAAYLAILPALGAFLFAADAVVATAFDSVPRRALAALTAIAVTAVFLGETAAALVVVFAGALAAAASTAALATDSDVRWLGVACAGMAGVLPGAGVSAGLVGVLVGAFGASAGGDWAGVLVAPLSWVAMTLISYALFRVYDASIRAPTDRASAMETRSDALVVVLGATAILGGAALGAGSSVFGGRAVPFARRLIEAKGGLDDVPRLAFLSLILSMAAAIVGLVAARRAGRRTALPRWMRAVTAPADFVARAFDAGGRVVAFFVHAVGVLDEAVIDDATTAAGSGAHAVVRVLRRDSGQAERLRNGLVLAMVAVLGVVVLSSVVLE